MSTIEEEVNVSLCVDCARHPSLKRVVDAKPATGTCSAVVYAPDGRFRQKPPLMGHRQTA